MRKINKGDRVYYIDRIRGEVLTCIVHDFDIIDGIPRVWKEDSFGCFAKDSLCKTRQEAENRLKKWKKYNNEIN